MLPPCRQPGHNRDERGHADGGGGVVHVCAVDGVDGGEVEGDDGEEQVQHPDDVEGQAEAAEGVGGVDVVLAPEAAPDAHEERHYVGEVCGGGGVSCGWIVEKSGVRERLTERYRTGELTEALSGDCEHGVEAGDGAEVDGHERHIHDKNHGDGVDGDVERWVDVADYVGEGEAAVTGEGEDDARALRHQEGQAHERDDGDEGGEAKRAGDGAGRFVEDGDQRHAGGCVCCGLQVADAEHGRDEKCEPGECPDPDGPDDGLGRVVARVLHLLGHVRCCVVAGHAEGGL